MKPKKVIKAWAGVFADNGEVGNAYTHYCIMKTREQARAWTHKTGMRVHKCEIRILPNRKSD